MAIINKKDFSILAFDTREATRDDYFECDDLIAPAISLLNRKGYRTDFCCSGHPYGYIQEGICFHKLDPDDYQVEEGFSLLYFSNEVPEDCLDEEMKEIEDKCYVVEKCDYMEGFYILFDKVYEFPPLPEGAELDNHLDSITIRWDFDDYLYLDYFERMDKIYEFNKAFYEWVKTLPSLV